MNIQDLRREMSRLDCAVRHCGPHGLIFTQDFSGGLQPQGGGLHYWNEKDNIVLDFKEVRNCLSELPAHSGEFAVRRLLKSLAGRR